MFTDKIRLPLFDEHGMRLHSDRENRFLRTAANADVDVADVLLAVARHLNVMLTAEAYVKPDGELGTRVRVVKEED